MRTRKYLLLSPILGCLTLALILSLQANQGSPCPFAKTMVDEAISKGYVPAAIQAKYQQNITREEFSELAVNYLAYKAGFTVDKIKKIMSLNEATRVFSDYIKRSSFENFKSTSCHKLKEMGDIDFIIELPESGEIRNYYEKGWYAESFYLLAMLDYLSRINHIDLCLDYEDIRKQRLRLKKHEKSYT